MDRLDAMSVLIAAVERGSFSRASRDLGLPLATVSRKVAQLEAHLNAVLITRSTKGLELTPAGRSYVASARAILEQLTEVERAAAGEYTEPRGDLVISAPVMFGRLHVLPIVSAFLESYPAVSVGLVLTDRVVHLQDDQVDVALRIGFLPDSSLIATRVGSVRRVVCGSPTYLAANGTPQVPDDVTGHNVVSLRSVSSPGSWHFESAGKDVTVPLSSRLSVSTVDAAIDAALSGVGLFRTLSYQLVEHVRSQRLNLVLEEFEPPPRPVNVVYDRQHRMALKLRAFLDFAVPQLRQRLAQMTL